MSYYQDSSSSEDEEDRNFSEEDKNSVSCVDENNWQSPLSSPGDRLAASYNHSKFTDLTISFPGHDQIIKAHRFVLAISSPVFASMMFGPLAEGDTLNLPEDPPEAFKWLMKHIYCGVSDLPDISLALEIYNLSTKYQMDALVSLCSKFLQKKVNVSNLSEVYDTALLFDDTRLQDKCSEVMTRSANDILSSKVSKHLSRKAMKHMLQQELCVTTEVTVFQGLVKWGTTQLSKSSGQKPLHSVRQEIKEFLPMIRFLTMTLKEFVEHVIPSDILTLEESNAILRNINQGKSVPLPPICSKNRKSRANYVYRKTGLNYVHGHQNI